MPVGVRSIVPVNSASVDLIEKALQQKVETVSNFNDNPVAGVRQIFKGFDQNGSGKVSRTEFTQALVKLNFTGMDREISAVFDRYDIDNSGYLELQEFANALFKKGDKKLRATSTIGRVREVLAMRAGGFQALQDIGRQFKIIDKNGDGKISRTEMSNGMDLLTRGYGMTLSRAENERIFQAFDADNSGFISYSEFIRGVRGEMNEGRRSLVKQAFAMLDENGDGTLTVAEIAHRYNVKEHPHVLSGEWTEKQAVDSFLQAWDKSHSGSVSEDDFIDYFEWISCNIDNDDYFELVMRNAFHMSGGEGWAENTTNRRVLATLKDGTQKVLEIKNDLGMAKDDIPAMMANLKQQGYDVECIALTGGN